MSDLERKILNRIEQDNLSPRPSALFLAKRSVFWALAIVSLALGGLSFALIAYLVKGLQEKGWQSLDEVPVEELLFSLPVVYALMLPLLFASAWFGLRHTRRGYRWRPEAILATSLAASAALGFVLHVSGAAPAIHGYLTDRFPAYRLLTNIPYDEWSHPELGRLGGKAERMLDPKILQIMDFRGKRWTVDVSHAHVMFEGGFVEEGDVAITGRMTGPSAFSAEVVDEFD